MQLLLIKAVRSGNSKEVQILLKSGADPNTKDMIDRYILALAAAKNDAEIVKSLLDAGADPNVKGINNQTALASTSNPIIVKWLLEAGADPEIKNNDGLTPIMIAASDGDIEIVKILIESNSDLNAKDVVNRSALGLAAHNGHNKIVNMLLKAGADPNSKSNSGTTALMMAAVDGKVEMVKLLLKYGADPNIKDVNGNMAITGACAMGYANIVGLLSKEKEEKKQNKEDAHKKVRILCLDDYSSILKTYQQILQEQGYEAIISEDSEEALSILRNNKIDIFIQDFNHPMVNGAEILKIMKADDELKNIPVIMITAMTRNSIAEKLKKYDLDIDHDLRSFIMKPFKTEKLLDIVENVINDYDSMESEPLSPLEMIKRMKNIPEILEWSRNKHLVVSGPNVWGTHHVFIDNDLTHCVVILKSDLKTSVFIGDPVNAQEWQEYDERLCLVSSKKMKTSWLEWKVYKDFVLYKGSLLPPKKNSVEPYSGKVMQVEELSKQYIDNLWIVKTIGELYN